MTAPDGFWSTNDARPQGLCHAVADTHRSHTNKVPLKTFYSLQIPKSYLNCTEDIALPPGEWGWHPRMSSRLGLYRLVQMPGRHEAIFTNPQLLADKFVEAGRD